MVTTFETDYNLLNDRQREAVDAVEGPVMVIAGPGTGKTQLLSLRVANILRQTDTSASNILCLTFTNSAAANMRSRLNSLIGPEAHRVVVRTFHSFAAEVMNQYPDYFWNGARLSTAPDAIQLEIVRDILGTLPLHNPLASKFAGNLTAINDVQKSINLIKEAGLTPAKLTAMLQYNLKYIDIIEPQLAEILAKPLSAKRLPEIQAAVDAIPDDTIDEAIRPLRSLSAVLKSGLTAAIASDEGTGKTKSTGDWKKRWIQTVAGQKGMFDERRRNAWWLAVAEVYGEYRDALHVRGYYDYADMIVEVITQLERQPELLASVQERFLYVLIDEFQDTNAAQLQIAHLVATHHTNDNQPNLMVVGDDDQSIYAFNGAELSNMLSFQSTYPSAQTIVLQKNYRSTQSVLDIARSVIEQADDRLVKRDPRLVKDLKAVSTIPAGKIQHLQYPTREHELYAVAQSIAGQWETSSGSSVAVLARSHESLRRISVYLNELNIPISYEQQNDILRLEVVQLIFQLVKTLGAVRQGDTHATNHLIADLLRYPVWGISDITLWKLAVDNYQSPKWLNSLLEHDDEKLQSIGQWLVWLARSTEPLTRQLEYLIGIRTGEYLTSPVRAHYLQLPLTTDYIEALSGIQLLVDLGNEFSEAGEATLEDFRRFIELNQGLDNSVTDQSWFVTGDRAVQLMTVHKSKGLEFDAVYLVDAVEDGWQPRSVSRKPPANLPFQPYGELQDDYVRLLYVALTRARHTVTVASYGSNEQGKVILPTPMVISALPPVLVEGSDVAPAQTILESALHWPRLESTDEKVLLAGRLDNFHLSATGLIQFLNVAGAGPQTFLENQLLRLPSASSTVMEYGTAMHAALQTGQQLANDSLPVLPGMLERYEAALAKQHLDIAEFDRYLEFGSQVLTDLIIVKGFSFSVGGIPELALNDVYLGEARIGGKLDHVSDNSGSVIISDYKTGKPLHNFNTKDQTKAVKAWQHRTQLLFYTLLVSGSNRFTGTRQIDSQMVYVEAETAKELTLRLTPSQEDIERTELLAQAVWRHVTEVNFPDISRYSADLQGITDFEDDLLAGRI